MKLSANVLLIIVLVLLSVGLSIGEAELPGNVQTIADSAANLALALASSDHIKQNKSSWQRCGVLPMISTRA